MQLYSIGFRVLYIYIYIYVYAQGISIIQLLLRGGQYLTNTLCFLREYVCDWVVGNKIVKATRTPEEGKQKWYKETNTSSTGNCSSRFEGRGVLLIQGQWVSGLAFRV